jgi:regulator of protease activity HflC (stomatin/prohibitin superfamily)
MVCGTSRVDCDGVEATVITVAVALAATAALVCAVVRTVPAGHRGVVTRAGRVARSRPSGLVVVLPGVERVHMVALHPRPIGPLTVTALTRDGAEVRLVVNVLWCVVDPTLAVHAVPDASGATADAVERALHHLVANLDLANLLRDRELFLTQLPVTALPLLTPLGVEVLDVDLLDAQVRVCPALLQLLA